MAGVKRTSGHGLLRAGAALLGVLLLCMTSRVLADPLGYSGEEGFLSSSGNNSDVAAASGNNIYFRLLDDSRIATLYIPWPYAEEVTAATIQGLFRHLDQHARAGAYIRGRFELLEQAAVATVETYKLVDGAIVFECGTMSVCSLHRRESHVELVRPGIINEHITRYDFVAAN